MAPRSSGRWRFIVGTGMVSLAVRDGEREEWTEGNNRTPSHGRDLGEMGIDEVIPVEMVWAVLSSARRAAGPVPATKAAVL